MVETLPYIYDHGHEMIIKWFGTIKWSVYNNQKHIIYRNDSTVKKIKNYVHPTFLYSAKCNTLM